MNKSELIEAIARKADATKTETEALLNSFISTVIEEVKKGQKVAVTGLGNFEKAHRAARTGINPSTGEKIQIGAKDVPKFKAAKAFKEAVA